jgi:hypothetical protein
MRYRAKINSTQKQEPCLKHIARLGKVSLARGYRFMSTRFSKWSGQAFTTTYECVLVKGENGTARFYSTWGYGGSGPHLTRDILLAAGFSGDIAAQIAFHSPRKDELGVDWEAVVKDGEVSLALAA